MGDAVRGSMESLMYLALSQPISSFQTWYLTGIAAIAGSSHLPVEAPDDYPLRGGLSWEEESHSHASNRNKRSYAVACWPGHVTCHELSMLRLRI